MSQTIVNPMTNKVIPDDVLPVPSDLKNIPGVGLSNERPDPNSSRFLLTGVPGIGKSTFLFSNPRAIVVDLENSAQTCHDLRALPFQPTSAQKVRDFIEKLIKRGPKDYKMVVFDSYDELVELFSNELMEKNGLEDVGDYKGGHGKGYFVVRREIFGLLDRLRRAGFGWTLIAHVSKRDENGRTVQNLAVSGSFRDIAVRKVDHLMHLEWHTPDKVIPPKKPGGNPIVLPGKGAPVRVLAMRPGGESRRGSLDDVKVRLPFPDHVNLPEYGSWAAFEKEFAEAVDRRDQARYNHLNPAGVPKK